MEVADLRAKVTVDSSGVDFGTKKILGSFDKIYNKSIKLNQTIELFKNGWASASQSVQKAIEVTERAARKADMEATFKRLADAQKRSSEQMLKQLQTATKGALDEYGAIANANQAMMAGLNFDQVVTTMKYLQRYAKIAGKEFNTLRETMMTGLARGSTQLLDDAGIQIAQVSFLAQKERELGRGLTEVEKKSYLVAEAIDQMKRKMGALGSDVLTTSDYMQKMKADWQNFIDWLGKIGLKIVGIGKMSYQGWKAIFLEMDMLFTRMSLSLETTYSGIVMTVRNKMMEVMMIVRDMLNRTAAALAEYDNAIAQQAARTASAMANWFNSGAVALFDKNMDTITGATAQKLEAHIAMLKEKRKQLLKEMDQLKKFMLGELDGADGGNATFDLSASVGTASNEKKTKDKLQSIVAAQEAALDKIKRATLSELDYKRWALKQELAEYKNMVKQKIISEDDFLAYAKTQYAEIDKLASKQSDNAKKYAQDSEGAFKSFFADGLKGQFSSVEDAFTSFCDRMIDVWVDSVAEMSAKSLFKSGGSSFFGGIGDAIGSLFNAKGNAFVNGHLQAFASGGIVNRPTFFSYAGGMGVLGEAGTEAIVPLARDNKTGNLGINATGLGAPNIQLVVQNNTGTDAKVTTSGPEWDGEKYVITTIMDAYTRNRHGLKDVFSGRS